MKIETLKDAIEVIEDSGDTFKTILKNAGAEFFGSSAEEIIEIARKLDPINNLCAEDYEDLRQSHDPSVGIYTRDMEAL